MNTRPPQRQKHIPIRTCVVCREKAGKRTLMRVVRAESGVQLDLTGKVNGRGAYVCDSPLCWQKMVSSDVLEKALRTKLTAEDRERLRQAQP